MSGKAAGGTQGVDSPVLMPVLAPVLKPGPAPVLAPTLAIETSCDETAAAILAPDGAILAEAVLSQQDHASFGGVVPEIAARAHLHHLPQIVAQVLDRAGLAPADLGAVAATLGPGLIGGLVVGSGFAKGMAIAAGKPFVGINHLEAHALTARLPGLTQDGAPFPYLLLLVSGGHCQLVLVEAVGRYIRLGGTIDDAVGEAFDKVAKMLGLGWPGGPALERLASEGRPGVTLPRPLLGRPGCDFSCSGLKTAVAKLLAPYQGALPRQDAADIAAAFQAAVVDVLVDRVRHATAMAPQCSLLVVAGGVAANGAIRTALAALAEEHRLTLSAPPLRLCGDNAVMVAWAAIERLRIGAIPDGLAAAPRPRWPLSELTGADAYGAQPANAPDTTA
jgi:N6-L-threonylcarbamoyladenine synthase